MFDLDTEEIFLSRDVAFMESTFPFESEQVESSKIQWLKEMDILAYILEAEEEDVAGQGAPLPSAENSPAEPDEENSAAESDVRESPTQRPFESEQEDSLSTGNVTREVTDKDLDSETKDTTKNVSI